MKTNFIKSLPLAFLASASLVACSDEDFGYTKAEMEYAKNFTAAFGKIDPEQDFNLATRSAVTVNVSRESEIKVYAKYGRNYRLVADYQGVTGTQTLEFDVVEGTTDIRVSDGSMAFETTVGSSVSFASTDLTRGIYEYTDFSTKTANYLEMSHELATAWVQVIPERGDRTQNKKYGTNLGKVTQDFTYVSQGEFTMYPMFSWTSSNDQIGIYFTDREGNYHEVVVMDNSFSGEDLQYKRYKNESNQDDPNWHDVTSHQPAYGSDQVNGDGTHTLDNIAAVRGKGVTVKLPKGTVFGMYLQMEGGPKYYSESKLNEDVGIDESRDNAYALGNENAYTITTNTSKKACHASSFYCTVDSKEYQFLGFEDWNNQYDGGGNSDFDLNDFMVLFDGTLPSVNDHETAGWILAYEDLGNTFDWDFNDIVAKIQHVSGQNYATFTPLAAVGTLNSYVKYNDSYITRDKATSEIHAMMGATDAAPHAIINGYDKGNPGKSVTFNVPENFSMTVLGNVSDMGGLTLEVEKDGEAAAAAVIAYQGSGATPEVICLPEFWYDDDDAPRFRSEWAWPTEHSSIKHVYPHFADWVSDKSTFNEWYKDEPQGTAGTGGTVGDDTKGAAVAGPFITTVATGAIVDRVDPKPIKVLKDPLYVAYQSNTPFSAFFTTKSNGALTVSSADVTTVSVANPSDYETGTIYGAKVGETTIKIHQLMGTGDGKQWPVSDETVRVIVLPANDMRIGIFDQYTGMSSQTSVDVVVGEDVNIYFYTTAGGTHGGVFSASADNDNVTVGTPEASAVINTTGFVTVHAAKVGTSVVTVSQAQGEYAPVSKTITINVTAKPTTLSLAQNSVSVGRNNEVAYVNINTNNNESTPVVAITSGSGFEAVYDNGRVKITGTANGSGVVTVSQPASATYAAATDVTLDVTVTDPTHALTCNGESSYVFTAFNATQIFSATSTTGTVSVSSDKPGVATATIDNGTVTITSVANGTATVTVTVTGDGYLTTNKEINVSVENYTTIPLNKFDLLSGKGRADASIFGDATQAKVTIVYSESPGNAYTDVFYGYYNSGSDAWGSDAPGNVKGNDTNVITFIITSDMMTQIKSIGNWGYEFKQKVDKVQNVYFE